MPVAERYLVARKTAKDRLNLDHQITQADLAVMLGVNRLSVINIERGTTREPRDSTHQKTCQALRVNYEWLKHGDGPMDPDLPEYELPEVEKIEVKTSIRTPNSLDGRYSYTPVVVVSSSENNKDWECIFPDVEAGKVIISNLASVLDLDKLRNEPVFYADVFMMLPKDNHQQTAYILKVYL